MKQEIHYRDNISWGQLGSKVYVFNEDSGDIFMLDNLSRDIWLCINKFHNMDEIILNVCDLSTGGNEISINKIILGFINKNLLEWRKESEETK